MSTTLQNSARPKSKFNIYELNLVAIFTGYPFISFIPDFLHIDSRVVTVPFRFVALLLSLSVLFIGANNKTNYKKSLVSWLLIIFYVLYIFKILSNLIFGPDVNYALSKEEYIFWSVGICFIPMLSVQYTRKINFTRVAKSTIYVLAVILVISLFNNQDALQNSIETRLSGNSALNSISYGHLGVTLGLLSVFFIGFKRQNLIFLATFMLGIYIMLIAGSRSPVVAFVGCLIFMAIMRRNKLVIGSLAITFVVVVTSFTAFIGVLKQVNPVIVDRMTGMFTDKDKTERDILYNDAVDDFLQYPVTGKHFLLTHGFGAGFYPHNLLLEAFMAIGFIGGCFFIYLLVRALIFCIKFLSSNYSFSWVPLLFLQALILGLASGSLWGSENLWVLMTLLFTIGTRQKMLAKKAVIRNKQRRVLPELQL